MNITVKLTDTPKEKPGRLVIRSRSAPVFMLFINSVICHFLPQEQVRRLPELHTTPFKQAELSLSASQQKPPCLHPGQQMYSSFRI